MIEIKEMQAEHIYLVKGAACSGSTFFERESDCKYFLQLIDRFLSDYIEVNQFQHNKDGWEMIITTKSEEAICSAYHRRRSQSKKCDDKHAFDEVWKMLSEQYRFLLSTYVKKMNRQ